MGWEKKFVFSRLLALGTGILFLGFLCWGRPTTLVTDRDHDGVSERTIYFWKGEKIREEVDSNQDGIKDIWRVFRGGKPFELRVDTNFDRKVDLWAHYENNGELTTYRVDIDYDGKSDFSGPYPFRAGKINLH